VFGASALRVSLDEVGNGIGAELTEVWDLSRKTLGKKRAYKRRVAGNGSLSQPALLAQVMLKLTENYLQALGGVEGVSTSLGRSIRHRRPRAAISPLCNLPDLRRLCT
jgi:hypothetical protein